MFKSDKKRTLIMLLVVGVLVVLVGVSYAFITFVIDGQKQLIVNAGVLDLYLDEKNELTISNALPMYDEVGMIQEEAFEFSLVNKTNNATNYVLKLVKIAGNNDLSENVVKYGLMKEEHPTIGYISDLNNGIIDSGTIAGSDTLDYELRLWIDYQVGDNLVIKDKSLSYRIDIEVSQNVETNQDCFEYVYTEYLVTDYNACIEYMNTNANIPTFRQYSACVSIPSNIYDFRDRYETHFQEMLQRGIIVEGNKAYVTGYTCDSDVVEIPEIIEVDASELGQASNQKLQLPVIGIGENAFTNYIEPSKSDIKDYTVKPLGMSSIDKLSKVIMPDTIEFVLEGAFNNVGLKEVKISNNMKILSSGAFASNSLRSISLPDSLLSIGISTFVNNQLEEVELPRNLKFIDNQAFAMNHLKTITVPSNIATIESFAFSNNQLNEVILSEGLREIKEEAFAYNDIKTITIPSTVQNIESRSLYENPNLHTIVNKTRLGFDWYNICFGVESDENFSTGTIQHWDGIHNVTITSE